MKKKVKWSQTLIMFKRTMSSPTIILEKDQSSIAQRPTKPRGNNHAYFNQEVPKNQT